jgi:outer membrane protein OmpA-like peptidoglycan-associated protein
MKRAVLTGSVISALVLAIALGWMSFERIRDLELRLEQAKRQAEVLSRKAQDYARELQQTGRIASAAQDSAAAAAEKAREAAAARVGAEEKTRAAEKATARAESEARQSRAELTAIQERRAQELNRMQEALGRIAATRRTASGLVIDLASDSFHFDFDKATLRTENREILSRIAGVLLASNGYRLFVHGHTDDVGTEEYNRRLSERRAESVASYLISAGVDQDVVETQGFGKSSPRAARRTAEARHKNRRVEIVVVDSIIQYRGVVPGAEGRS